MKDEIKTFAEYKELVREYEKSDSLSGRKSIEHAVYIKARDLLHELIALYAKYDRDYIDDSDFREDRGHLFMTEFNENEVWMNYYDHWAYGGECDIGIEVKMKYLDNDKMATLEKELRIDHVSHVKKLIKENKAAIENLKKEVKKLEAEVEKFEAEEKIR